MIVRALLFFALTHLLASELVAHTSLCMESLSAAQVVLQCPGGFTVCPKVLAKAERYAVAKKLVQQFNRLRKTVEDEELNSAVEEYLLEEFQRAIENHQPIRMILPSFPAKSPNHKEKVLGPDIDLSEKIALSRISDVVNEMKALYDGGVDFLISLDGEVFTGSWWNSDEIVDRYAQQLIDYNKNPSIRFIRLSDFYPQAKSRDEVRRIFMAEYAPSEADIRKAIQEDPNEMRVYLALAKFIATDRPPPAAGQSANSVKAQNKQWAVEDMQRNTAHGALLANRFPNFIRLSVRPQGANFRKVGVNLIQENENRWGTPWHGVIVVHPDGSYEQMKRSEAEALGYQLIHIAGRPHHFYNHRLPIPPNTLDAVPLDFSGLPEAERKKP